MRLRLAALAAVLALGLAGCTAPASEQPQATRTAPTADAPVTSACEPVAADGLCVTGDEDAEAVAEIVRQAFTADRLGALIIGVWRDGEPLVVGAMGESMPGVPATTDMHHRIGNVSASFLTTVFLQLVDEGTLALDAPLAGWYPDLPDAERITLEQLARSTTGYAHHPATQLFVDAFVEDPFRPWDPDELIAIGTADGTAFEPGSAWRFSDTNLVILGEVIEAETGESVHSHIQRRILDPLGFDRTATPTTGAVPEPVLHGFTDERGVWEEATHWTPTWVVHAGDLASNIRDVSRWIEVVASGELLSDAMHAEMLAPVTVEIGAMTNDFYYAMGIGSSNGWVFTNPSLHGYRASVGHLPEEGVTVVIFATLARDADHGGRPDSALFQRIGELLVPEQPPRVVRG